MIFLNLARKRTGTNYLNSLLSSSNEFKSSPFMRSGKNFYKYIDMLNKHPKLAEHFNSNDNFTTYLLKHNNLDYNIYENCYYFNNDYTDEIYNYSYLFENLQKIDNVYFILLFRDYLDSFISLKKARLINETHNIDTSDIKINISTLEFNQYIDKWNKYYDVIFKYFPNICVINYDDFKINNHKYNFDYIINKLNNTYDLSLDVNINDFKIDFKKQDLNDSYIDKIINIEDINTLIELNNKGNEYFYSSWT